MRTATVNVYQFDELSEDAKEIAREWYRNGLEYFWGDDAMNSVADFVRSVGGTDISEYRIEPFGYSYIDTNATSKNFRGLKLRDIDRDAMPTGYCIDCTLYQTFYDVFKRTGDAHEAFVQALDAAAQEIKTDWEYQYSDEATDEAMRMNGYEFTEDGKIY